MGGRGKAEPKQEPCFCHLFVWLFTFLCSGMQICQCDVVLWAISLLSKKKKRREEITATFDGQTFNVWDGNECMPVSVFFLPPSSCLTFFCSFKVIENNTSRVLFGWLFLSSACCKVLTGDRISICLPLTYLCKTTELQNCTESLCLWPDCFFSQRCLRKIVSDAMSFFL